MQSKGFQINKSYIQLMCVFSTFCLLYLNHYNVPLLVLVCVWMLLGICGVLKPPRAAKLKIERDLVIVPRCQLTRHRQFVSYVIIYVTTSLIKYVVLKIQFIRLCIFSLFSFKRYVPSHLLKLIKLKTIITIIM